MDKINTTHAYSSMENMRKLAMLNPMGLATPSNNKAGKASNPVTPERRQRNGRRAEDK